MTCWSAEANAHVNWLLCAHPSEVPEALPANWELHVIGVGSQNATIHLTELLIRHLHPERMLLMGTAGSADPSMPIGTLVSVSEVIHPPYRPDILQIPEFLNVTLPAEVLPGLPTATAFSTAGVSMNVDSFIPSGKLLAENMEVMAVAAVANRFGLRFSALLGITNYLDEAARNEYRNNTQKVHSALHRYFSGTFQL